MADEDHLTRSLGFVSDQRSGRHTPADCCATQEKRTTRAVRFRPKPPFDYGGRTAPPCPFLAIRWNDRDRSNRVRSGPSQSRHLSASGRLRVAWPAPAPARVKGSGTRRLSTAPPAPPSMGAAEPTRPVGATTLECGRTSSWSVCSENLPPQAEYGMQIQAPLHYCVWLS